MFIIFILPLVFLSSSVLSLSSPSDDFCKNYDWGKIEKLVEPYLDETSFNSLVMQGLSSEYNTSVAAYQAIDPRLPKEVHDILNRIVQLNCS